MDDDWGYPYFRKPPLSYTCYVVMLTSIERLLGTISLLIFKSQFSMVEKCFTTSQLRLVKKKFTRSDIRLPRELLDPGTAAPLAWRRCSGVYPSHSKNHWKVGMCTTAAVHHKRGTGRTSSCQSFSSRICTQLSQLMGAWHRLLHDPASWTGST